MSDKRKKLARALAQKTGMSYQAAINALATGATSPVGAPPRSVTQLLHDLRANSTFGIIVGRVPAVGRSAIFKVAVEHSRELARTPLYYADSGAVQMGTSLSEHQALLAAGAAEAGGIQLIHAFTIDRAYTPSEQCEACHRWIWCHKHDGAEPVEGNCHCGHRYRIIFDAMPDWTRPLELRCMDCGTEHRLSQPNEKLNPWRWINERQVQCNRCVQRTDESIPITLEDLNYAHVRVIPTPVRIDENGVRHEIAPDGAVGVCQVRLIANLPEVVTLEVPWNGSYTREIPKSRVRIAPTDETDHGYQLRAELRLVGLRIVIDPHHTHDVGDPGRSHIWTEPA